jgi:hypothetical protein
MSERTDTERLIGLADLGVDTMSNSERDVVCTYVRHKGDVELLRQAIDAAIDAEEGEG